MVQNLAEARTVERTVWRVHGTHQPAPRAAQANSSLRLRAARDALDRGDGDAHPLHM
jgi:hypothetical protein